MGLFNSVKNFCSKTANILGLSIDEKTKKMEDRKIVELASQDVSNLRKRVTVGIEKCAETKLAVSKLLKERDATVKKLAKVTKDYSDQIEKIKGMIVAGASDEDVRLAKIEANSLLMIKKSITSQIDTLNETTESLSQKQVALLNGLKVMNSNISVMECELSKQKARRNYIQLHNDIVRSISGAIGIDEASHLNRLDESNTMQESIIELNEDVLGTPSLLTNASEIDAEVESDIANVER